MTTDSVAIIGAGPVGLSAARLLKLLEIPFCIYEKHHDVGGIWDINNEGTPMYKSAHFISSKTMSGHKFFPMPDDYPDYPSREQILNYIKSFAKANQLYEFIKFKTKIKNVDFKDSKWEITAENGEKFTHRWLICASGALWSPNTPTLKGQETFKGEIIHGQAYKDSDYLKNKRVLVVGAGNSGVDIACDAAFMADQAFISMRRGYHIIPKHIFGLPADVFGDKTGGGPMWLSQWFFGKLLTFLNGNVTRYGLQKPDHKILSSHPILNSQILHYLQHGDLKAKKDIDFLDGDKVFFKDGSCENIDLIILCTGYNYEIPYLEKHFFEWKNNRPQLFLRLFNPKYPTLFVNGFFETNGGAYSLFDEMNYLIAKTIESQLKNLDIAHKINKTINEKEPDLSGTIQFIDSERHTGYVDKDTYLKVIHQFVKKCGWEGVDDFLKKKIPKTFN